MKAVTITTDNVVSIVNVESNGSPLYQQMHEAVGGYYENVYPRGLDEDYVMVVNEEGLLMDLPLNSIASYLYGTFQHGQPIVGNVIILKSGYFKGEPDVVGMSDEEATKLVKKLLNSEKGVN